MSLEPAFASPPSATIGIIEPLAESASRVGTPPYTPPVRLFAVGNAGINLMELLIESGIPACSCVALNTDASSLYRSSAAEKLALELKETADLGMIGDPGRGAAAAESRKDQITALCGGARTIIILAGLGGGVGTGAAPVVAQFARVAGVKVMAFGILPFACEGNLREKLAAVGLEDLREAAHLAVAFANERAMALATEATTLLETFKLANELLAVSVRAAYHAFCGGTVMGLPFSDVCALVRDSGACTLLAAESSGQDRVAETSDRLLNHPALDGSSVIAEADAVAVYVLGGPSLAMLEVNRIVERIGRECGSVPLIMGAAIEPALGGKLVVAVLTGRTDVQRCEPRREECHRSPRSESAIGDLKDGPSRRPPSRILPPPPEISPERAMEIRDHQAGRKPRKGSQRMRQTQLPLDIVSKGRFDKAEPTIHKGEDLDVPTYVRRGIALN